MISRTAANLLKTRATSLLARPTPNASSRYSVRFYQPLHEEHSTTSPGAHGETTYLEPSSGKEIPVRKEEQIALYYNAQAPRENPFPDNMDIFHGAILPKEGLGSGTNFAKWSNVLQTPGFQLFSRQTTNETTTTVTAYNTGNICQLVPFDPANPDATKKKLQKHNANGFSTAIALGRDCISYNKPGNVASAVGRILDNAPEGTGQYIWVESSELDTPQNVVDLFQELDSLDLPGAIMKDRLMVNVWGNEDGTDPVLDATMEMGMHRFVILQTNPISMIQDTAREHGKTVAPMRPDLIEKKS